MNRFPFGLWVRLSFLLCLLPLFQPAKGQVIISELLADNRNGLRDQDGTHSAWIELWNRGAASVNLNGWHLISSGTNSWRIPGVALLPNSYLVVFASGKNRATVTAELHTNFLLSKKGDSLQLTDSLGNLVSSFDPYPSQNPDVSYGRDRINPDLVGYFTDPTPGGANSPNGPGFSPPVEFSRPSGTFTDAFDLILSTVASNAVIHYAFGADLPTESSPIFTEPISVTNTIEVQARAFVPGLLPGPVASEDFIRLDGTASTVNFTSDLPVIIFHNYGGGAVPASTDQYVMMEVFEPKGGVTSLTNIPDLTVNGIFHRHGSSTLDFPKSSFAVETHNSVGDNKNVLMAGLPAESDWIFYGINAFDKVLLHNPMAQELYRQMGYYSSRTRFVEVYLKKDAGVPGSITAANYNGLYVLEEKIKIGKNRVNVDKLADDENLPPNVTGGYLFSIDRPSPGENQFSGAGLGMNYLGPKYADIITPQRAPQKKYISDFFNSFGNALNGLNWTNPVTGYAAYFDVETSIDFHIHEVVTFNVDALRLSTYLYKPRGGKLTFGPAWDYDRTQGSTDGRDFNPRVWRSTTSDQGTDMFGFPWWATMFRDPDFWQKYIDHYQGWRRTVLNLTNIYATLDSLAAEVRQAQSREVKRWRGTGASDTSPRSGTFSAGGFSYNFPGTYQGEVNFTKIWYSNRLDFIDKQFVQPPGFTNESGRIGRHVILTSAAPAGVIYYTLDGTDPRSRGGRISPTAQVYNGSITLTNNAVIMARVLDTTHSNLTGSGNPPLSSPWSGPVVIANTNAIVLSQPRSGAAGSFTFTVNAPADSYTIERTTAFNGAIIAGSVTLTNGPVDFTDFHAKDDDGFYTAIGPNSGSTSDQEIIAVANAAPAIADCLEKARQENLDIRAEVNTVGQCPDGGDQRQVIFSGSPHCPPNQICPLFIKIVAKVTFACDGTVLDATCEP